MEESVVLVVDYDKICRLCLQSTGVMSDIFGSNGEISMQELILCATGLNITKGDRLPKNICHKCRYLVELSCELRTMAVKAHELLSQAGNDLFFTECLEDQDITENLQHISNNAISVKMKQDLRLILQDDDELRLVTGNPEDVELDGNQAEEILEEDKRKAKVNSHVSVERTRKAAPKHLTCQICLSTFHTKEQVHKHAETHYKDSNLTCYLQLQRPYECEACRDGLISKKQLILHHRRHLGVNPFVCRQPDCGFVGKNQESLRHHATVHGARSQVCEACGAAYRRPWELRQHQHRTHRARARACPRCRRVCRNALTYRAHAATHAPPSHPCPWLGCPRAYRSRGALAAHARAHGPRAYRCPLCHVAAYHSRSLLNRHLRMHARTRVPKCDKCAATFEDYGAFYRHRVTSHGPWQPHRCTSCNQGYQSEAQMQKHMQTCKLANSRNVYADADGVDKENDIVADRIVVSSIQEIMVNERPLPFGVEELINRLRGQSILVQPGNMDDISKENLVLQELPPDELLYIEVVPDSANEEIAMWQH